MKMMNSQISTTSLNMRIRMLEQIGRIGSRLLPMLVALDPLLEDHKWGPNRDREVSSKWSLDAKEKK